MVKAETNVGSMTQVLLVNCERQLRVVVDPDTADTPA